MKIDRMQIDDLPEVLSLAEQLGYPNVTSDVQERYQEISRHDSYALFVARSESSGVLGWIQINAEPVTLLVGARADIAALVVDEGQRGKGIGRELVGEAEKWARSKGLTTIRVRSNVKRTDAHRFYQREGYALTKTANMFVKEIRP